MSTTGTSIRPLPSAGAREASPVAVSSPLVQHCALLRACLWAQAQHGSAVHVLRLLNLAVDLATESAGEAPPPGLREELRQALDELAEAGDAISLDQGRWLPAALREVPLPSSDGERLLVGGLPSEALPDALRGLVTSHGPFRRVRGPALGEALALPTEELNTWAGAPEEPLSTWAERLLQAQLESYSAPPEGLNLRVYAPERADARTPQGFRWTEDLKGLSGRYLSQRQRPFGAREYGLVDLDGGRPNARGAVLLPGEARRLMYAFDAKAGRPTYVGRSYSKETFSLTLGSELPRSEVRLLAVLGTLHVDEGRYYPREWRLPLRVEQLVSTRLLGLGVQFREPQPSYRR